MSRYSVAFLLVALLMPGVTSLMFSGCDSKSQVPANALKKTTFDQVDGVGAPEPQYPNNHDNTRANSFARSIEPTEEERETALQIADGSGVQRSFIFVDRAKYIEQDIQRLKTEQNSFSRTRTRLFFVRRESGPTDRLCLAVCFTKYGLLMVKSIELRQFNEVVFRGNVHVRIFGPGMQIVEIRLRKRIYTGMNSLVEGLVKGESEAIAFQKRHALPPLDKLKKLAGIDCKGMVPYVPELDRRRFLYLGECDCFVK